jgi:hypothetical protein
VIIYYKGPGKTSTQSNAAAVPTSRANAATGKGEDSTKELTSNSRSLAGQPSKTSLESRRSDTVADLQPVIIYYRTYSPAAILRGSEQRPIVPNEKQAAASSIRNNVSAANPRKPTDVTRRAKNEIPTGNSIADLDETLSADPKQPLTEPIMNSISPADSGLAVNPPEIETANLIVEKTVRKTGRSKHWCGWNDPTPKRR